MEATVKIQGFKEAQKLMAVLPDKFQRQTLLKMLRKSTRPMIRAARANLKNHGSEYANLARAIGNITAKSKNAILFVGPRMRGKWKQISYISHWVEYGTKGIKKSSGGRIKTEKDKQFSFVGKVAKGARYREDQAAQPFMRPAIDSTRTNVSGEVSRNFSQFLNKTVAQLVTKYNLR